jgi:hydrogenase maturation protein HypF
LVHDREIHMRCDDTVVRTAGGRQYPIRRSRGYAPAPLRLAANVTRHTLACGGELKNTFCLARDSHAFLSHHIGDMENHETLRSFREGIEHYCRLFDVTPELVSYDLHPEYLSTKYARELEEAGLPAVGVQHHHAHVGSVSSGSHSTVLATGQTGPCGVASSSRAVWRRGSRAGLTWNMLRYQGDRLP